MIQVLRRKLHNLSSDRNFSEIFTGSIYALASRVIGTALALVTSIIVARAYGAEAVGTLAVINSFLVLITIFTVLGTGNSILRLIPEHVAKYSVKSAFKVYRKTQYLVAAISLATGTLFYFASGMVADKIFNKPHLSFVFALAAGFVVFKSLMDLNTRAVRGLRLIRTFAFMQLLPALSMLVILLAITFLFKDQNNPVYAQLAAFVVTAVIGALIMDRAFKRKVTASDLVEPMTAREILAVSTPMLMTASMNFFVGQTGIILLGVFRTESEVGYYSIAVKLATLTAFVFQAINAMAAPKFSQLFHTGDMDELFHVAKKSTKLIFWTTVPILLVLVLLGKPILALLFGQEFAIAYPAMVFLVIGQFVNSISGSTGSFMNMTGKEKILRNIIFFSAVINVTLSLVLIPRFGLEGAAIAGMTSLCFWNIYTLIYIKSRFGRTIGYFPVI
jgi:O-antigen/teichoic acid export membrane protein